MNIYLANSFLQLKWDGYTMAVLHPQVHQAVLEHDLGVLQFNSILTISTWG